MMKNRDSDKAVRIAVVIPAHWGWRTGGSQQQAKLLIERLARNYCTRIRYFAARTGDRTEYVDHDVVNVSRLDRLHRYGHVWDYLSLQNELQHFSPDVIYQRVFCAYTGIVARYAKRTSTPFVWHISSDSDCKIETSSWRRLLRPHNIIDSKLARNGIRDASIIVAQTSDQSKLLQKNFGRTPDYMIRNFHPAPSHSDKPAGPIRVAWIANLKRIKCPELFVQLARALEDSPDVRFSMAGAPFGTPQRRREFAASISHCKNFEYLGELSQSEVDDLLQRSHLVVNTSKWEGFSNTFIQAWMHSVPVLTLGVNPDNLIEQFGLGYCCSSIGDMTARVRELASRPSSIAELGVNCREFSLENFSLSNADELASVIIDSVGTAPVLTTKELAKVG